MSLYPYKPEVSKVAGDIARMRKCRQKCFSRNPGLEKKTFSGSQNVMGISSKRNCLSCRDSIMKYDYNVFFSRSQGAFLKMLLLLYDFVPVQTESKQGLRWDRERISRNLGTDIKI